MAERTWGTGIVMTTYAYYPGCSLQSSAREYDLSTRAVCQRLGIELVEIPGWSCCGSSPASNADKGLSRALVVRNLLLVEQANQSTVIAPCSGCYKYFRMARQAVVSDKQARREVERLVDAPLLDTLPTVQHALEALMHDVDAVREAVRRPLSGLRVACYYGCVIGRPRGGFDDPENPTSMDRLMDALGAELVPYEYKTRCCGGGVLVPRPHVALDLTGHLLRKASEQGAACLAVACPLCALMLDTYQRAAMQRTGQRLELPILYFTQLMGLAFGLDERSLGLQHNVVSPIDLMATLQANTGAERETTT